MERFHVHFRVHPRRVVQPDLILPAAGLQFEVSVEAVCETHYAPRVAHFLAEPRRNGELRAATQQVGDLLEGGGRQLQVAVVS